MATIAAQTASFPMTRQGVRDLNQLKRPVLPISGQPASPATLGTNIGDTERIFCTGGGAALVALGLTRGSLLGLGLAALGGALLYRGLGGHCPPYAAAGLSTADGPPPGVRTE